MHNDELGKLIKKNQNPQRDAIHIAIAPVVAGQTLSPGQHIVPKSKGSNIMVAATIRKPSVGIVDPWLMNNVHEGDEFWICLHPNTIKSLRHVWEHDAFVPPTEALQKEVSEQWLKEYADELEMGFTELMAAADRWVGYGQYHTFHGHDTPDVCYDKNDEFWRHYENVRHVVVDKQDKTTFFSCSC